MTEESLFHEALARPPAERAAFLDAACAGQPELRAAVEGLLAAHEAPASLLDRPTVARPQTLDSQPAPPEAAPPHLVPTTDYHPPGEPGAVIAGRYTLQQKIGEGGMGEVWVARQTEPVKRQVALKLLKAGMDSRAVVARFEQERQALALMDHPHIARVLDGGLTPTGQPFFVMELVNGLPLTKFCDEARLTPRQRLELFVPICQAVQHAHQKGIVHRDLKPSNILVTLIDARPIPKVIDFGVAKAVSGKLTDESVSTQFGAVIGTLAYMAPEQAGYAGADIDTRADIYSLGVILYELLTGLRPIEARRLQQAAYTELIRIIQEEEPARPSTRLSTEDALPSLAAARQTEPRQLMALLRGELDWVVMKCLEKSRERRYETANGLAREVQRYLANEPVEARPPSAGYRLRKLLARHRGPVLAAGLVLLALVVGIAGTTFELIRAEHAWAEEARQRQWAEAKEKEAQTEKVNALNAAAAEKAAKEQTKRRLDQIEKGIDLLASLLMGINPRSEEKGGPTVYEQLRERARQAADQLDADAVGDPQAVARLQTVLGDTLIELGDFPKAIAVLEKACATRTRELGDNQPDTLASRRILARACKQAGKLDRAIPLLERTLQACEARLGRDHPLTLMCCNDLGSAYREAGKRDLVLPLLERAVQGSEATLGGDHPDTLTYRGNLAQAYVDAGKADLAIPLHERTVKAREARLGDGHPDTLYSRILLARAYQDAGKHELAIPLLERTLQACETRLGEDHHHTLTALGNLAVAYRDAGKRDLALPLYERTLKVRAARLGDDHPSTLLARHNLATAYLDAGKTDLAIPLLELTLKAYEARLGEDHPQTVIFRHNLAVAYRDAGKLDRAIPLFERALKASEAMLGDDHPQTVTFRYNLALAYRNAGKLDQAIPLFERTLKVRVATLGEDHSRTLNNMTNLAVAYWSAKRLDRSIPLYEEALRRQEARLGRQHPDTQLTVANLGVNYKDAGRLLEALPLLREAYRTSRTVPSLRWIGAALLDAVTKAGRSAEAVKLVPELLAEARQTLPGDSPQLAGVLVQYGQALLKLRAPADAEPLLRESLAIRTKTQPDVWTTFHTQALLGSALLGQQKHAAAEPLLLTGIEGMKQRDKTRPASRRAALTEALEQLVQLYEATDRKDDATRWRRELEAARAAQKPPEEQP
jgi:tetratricopeptide (TPR) repeat protein